VEGEGRRRGRRDRRRRAAPRGRAAVRDAGAAGVVPDSAFADGLGDAITGKLARLAGLRVIDRASVRSVADAAARPLAAGRTLGADYVLRATLRWARGADGQPRVQVSPVLDHAFRVALVLRRYGDAGELVARRRALDRALRAYQAKGGRIRASDPGTVMQRSPLGLMRVADQATGDALLAGTPATLRAQSAEDTLLLYSTQASLLLRRGDSARARPPVGWRTRT
jgi:hypothetical protein